MDALEAKSIAISELTSREGRMSKGGPHTWSSSDESEANGAKGAAKLTVYGNFNQYRNLRSENTHLPLRNYPK
jgi:hypothetical protein